MKADPHRFFDPALSQYPVRRVPTRRISDPLKVIHAPDRVEEYRRAMLSGQRFPPVSVLPLAGRFLVADGHKRFAAYRQLAGSDTLVEVWTVRRWAADQFSQLSSAAIRLTRALVKAPLDGTARRELKRLMRSDLRHWRRLLASLRRLEP